MHEIIIHLDCEAYANVARIRKEHGFQLSELFITSLAVLDAVNSGGSITKADIAELAKCKKH